MGEGPAAWSIDCLRYDTFVTTPRFRTRPPIARQNTDVCGGGCGLLQREVGDEEMGRTVYPCLQQLTLLVVFLKSMSGTKSRISVLVVQNYDFNMSTFSVKARLAPPSILG